MKINVANDRELIVPLNILTTGLTCEQVGVLCYWMALPAHAEAVQSMFADARFQEVSKELQAVGALRLTKQGERAIMEIFTQ